jgi:hypothetical protein
MNLRIGRKSQLSCEGVWADKAQIRTFATGLSSEFLHRGRAKASPPLHPHAAKVRLYRSIKQRPFANHPPRASTNHRGHCVSSYFGTTLRPCQPAPTLNRGILLTKPLANSFRASAARLVRTACLGRLQSLSAPEWLALAPQHRASRCSRHRPAPARSSSQPTEAGSGDRRRASASRASCPILLPAKHRADPHRGRHATVAQARA